MNAVGVSVNFNMKNYLSHYQTNQDTYNQIAQQRAQAVSIIHDELKTLLDELISLLPKNAKILDLGCGSGRDSKYLSQKKATVTGIDFSQKLLDIAKKTAPKAKFLLIDVTKDDLGKDEYDGILANASLLHLTQGDLIKVLVKLKTTLKKNGTIFARFISGHGEHLINKIYQTGEHSLFFTFYSKKTLNDIFSNSGLKVIKLTTNKKPTGGWWINIFAQKI
jgi:2-polyprenyl-3-methyl-5-hydroxy-6-metoxy-1,4-benzoquinol methylase